MRAWNVCGWLLLMVSACHVLAGIVSGELQYPSMRAFWLAVVSGACLLLSVVCFLICAAGKQKRRRV